MTEVVFFAVIIYAFVLFVILLAFLLLLAGYAALAWCILIVVRGLRDFKHGCTKS